MTKTHRQKIIQSREDAKIRVLAVYKMLDTGRKFTALEIKQYLKDRYDIDCAINTVYSDICAVDRFIPIESIKGSGGGFRKIDFNEVCKDG